MLCIALVLMWRKQWGLGLGHPGGPKVGLGRPTHNTLEKFLSSQRNLVMQSPAISCKPATRINRAIIALMVDITEARGPRPLVAVRFPRPMLAAVKRIAQAQDRTTPDMVREAVKTFLERAYIPPLAADGRSEPPALHPPWPAHGNTDEAAA